MLARPSRDRVLVRRVALDPSQRAAVSAHPDNGPSRKIEMAPAFRHAGKLAQRSAQGLNGPLARSALRRSHPIFLRTAQHPGFGK